MGVTGQPMTGTAGDPYPERELISEGQDSEAGYPRDLGYKQNKMKTKQNKREKSIKLLLMILCY